MAELSGRCTNRTDRPRDDNDAGRCPNDASHRVVCGDCGGFFANLCDDCAEELERVYNRFHEPVKQPKKGPAKSE